MNQRTGFRALVVNLSALASCFLFLATALAAEPSFDVIRDEIANHPGQTGAFVLDTGEEALLASAWLVNHAENSIEVQYFIWSTETTPSAERGDTELEFKPFPLFNRDHQVDAAADVFSDQRAIDAGVAQSIR